MARLMVTLDQIKATKPLNFPFTLKGEPLDRHLPVDDLFPVADLIDICGLCETCDIFKLFPDKLELWQEYALWCARWVAPLVRGKLVLECMVSITQYMEKNISYPTLSTKLKKLYDGSWECPLDEALATRAVCYVGPAICAPGDVWENVPEQNFDNIFRSALEGTSWKKYQAISAPTAERSAAEKRKNHVRSRVLSSSRVCREAAMAASVAKKEYKDHPLQDILIAKLRKILDVGKWVN